MAYIGRSKKTLGTLDQDAALSEQASSEFRDLGLGDDVSEIVKSQEKRRADFEAKEAAAKRRKIEAAKAYADVMKGLRTGLPSSAPPETKTPRTQKTKLSDKDKLAKPRLYKTCVCCGEIYHISQYPKTMPSEDCDHERNVCRMCMVKWIRI